MKQEILQRPQESRHSKEDSFLDHSMVTRVRSTTTMIMDNESHDYKLKDDYSQLELYTMTALSIRISSARGT
jgi:hypothetical protein